MAEAALPARRSKAFLALYAAANVGGVIAYNPLLGLIVPLKIDAIAADERLGLLTIAALAGAVAASLSNIAFGMLGDRSHARTGTRKPWAAAGLVATIATYVAIHWASDAITLVAAIILFQVAVNMLLSPLFAAIADEVPDTQKGVIGGLLSCAFPAASVVGWALTADPALGEGARLMALAVILVVLIAPFLALAPMRRAGDRPGQPGVPHARQRIDLGLAWLSRLLIQIAENTLFTYLLFYFLTLARGRPSIEVAGDVAWFTGIAFVATVPVSLAVGWASDRLGARKPFLMTAAVLTAVGLVAMAYADGWAGAVVAYSVFAIASTVFLGLHSAFTLQILPSPEHRGRDLGIVNLANTLPAIIGPALTWTLASNQDFTALLMLMAALALAGGALTLAISGDAVRSAPAA